MLILKFEIVLLYLVNKPLPVAGISEDLMSATERLSEKWAVGREANLQSRVYKFSKRFVPENTKNLELFSPEIKPV